MHIQLTADQAKLVRRRVKTGAYHNEQEVIDDALARLTEDEIIESVGIQNVRKSVEEGLAQLDRGEGITLQGDAELDAFFEDIKTRGRKRLAERQRSQAR